MRVVHLLRKPLSGATVAANALEHGCGVVFIEGCRLRTADSLDGGAYAQEGNARWDGAENWRFKREGGAGDFEQPSGRWPTNVILEHRPECLCDGTREVRGSQLRQVIHRSRSHSKSIGEQTDGFACGHTNEDGLESVEDWKCDSGCPVEDLDVQSVTMGMHSAGNEQPPKPSVDHGYWVDGGWKPLGENPDRHKDKGGASRFFKQVGGQR